MTRMSFGAPWATALRGRLRCWLTGSVIMATAVACVSAGPAALAASSAGTRLVVPCDVASLRQSITAAPDNATLVLTAGCTYRLTSALPDVEHNLTIRGNGATITRLGGSFTMLTVRSANLRLSRLSMTGARNADENGDAGAVEAETGAHLTVANCRFSDDDGRAAGAIEVTTLSNLSVSDSSFTGNHGRAGGAVVLQVGSAATVRASRFSDNTAGEAGGGAITSVNSLVTVTGSTFIGNTAGGDGGAISSFGLVLNVNHSVFSHNSGRVGGAIVNRGGPGTTFADSRFTANNATARGGAIATDSALNLVRDSMSHNHAGTRGGALAITGHTSLFATRITHNSAGISGGGVQTARAVSLTDGSVVARNHPDNCAGAPCLSRGRVMVVVPCSVTSLRRAITNAPDNATLSLTPGCTYRLTSALPDVELNLTIQGHGATITRLGGSFTMLTDRGFNLTLNRIAMTGASNTNPLGTSGAVLARSGSHLTVTRSAFRDDHGQVGGAILLEHSSAAIADSVFADDRSEAYGGAIALATGSAATVRHSAFSGDTAEEAGGALSSLDGVLTVAGSTFSGNTAHGTGGAIVSSGLFLRVTDSSFTHNSGRTGGAIYNDGTATTFADSRFSANTVTEGGGAVDAITSLNLVRDLLSRNHAGDKGGGLFVIHQLTTLFASRVTYNSAGVSGGGIQTSEPEVLSLAEGNVVAHNRPDNCAPASC